MSGQPGDVNDNDDYEEEVVSSDDDGDDDDEIIEEEVGSSSSSGEYEEEEYVEDDDAEEEIVLEEDGDGDEVIEEVVDEQEGGPEAEAAGDAGEEEVVVEEQDDADKVIRSTEAAEQAAPTHPYVVQPPRQPQNQPGKGERGFYEETKLEPEGDQVEADASEHADVLQEEGYYDAKQHPELYAPYDAGYVGRDGGIRPENDDRSHPEDETERRGRDDGDLEANDTKAGALYTDDAEMAPLADNTGNSRRRWCSGWSKLPLLDKWLIVLIVVIVIVIVTVVPITYNRNKDKGGSESETTPAPTYGLPETSQPEPEPPLQVRTQPRSRLEKSVLTVNL